MMAITGVVVVGAVGRGAICASPPTLDAARDGGRASIREAYRRIPPRIDAAARSDEARGRKSRRFISRILLVSVESLTRLSCCTHFATLYRAGLGLLTVLFCTTAFVLMWVGTARCNFVEFKDQNGGSEAMTRKFGM